MSEDAFQSLLVFVLPWVGLPIGAVVAYARQKYRDRQHQPTRTTASNTAPVAHSYHPGWTF